MKTKRRAPLYKELRDTLAAELAAGKFSVGGRFPTEQELCLRFGVGRHTVREALRGLQEAGLLSRQAGSGTVVIAQNSSDLYTYRIDSLEGLWQYAIATRFEKRHEIVINLREKLARTMGRQAGETWLRIAGVRRPVEGNNLPLCWTEIFVAEPWIGVREHLRNNDKPIYAALAEYYGLKIAQVERQITAIAMPSDMAEALGVEPSVPALMERRTYFGDSGEVWEITLSIHPADRFAHTTRLVREPGHSATGSP